jgi:predicted Zn-dependent peptidase
VSSINGAITNLWTQNLPDDYYQQYAKRIAAITKDDVLRVAKQYVTVNNLDIVIVGDRSVIEGPLKATGLAPIAVYDIEGNPLNTP